MNKGPITVKLNRKNEPIGIRVHACGDDFVIALKDNAAMHPWEKFMHKYALPNKRQWKIISIYLTEINKELEKCGGEQIGNNNRSYLTKDSFNTEEGTKKSFIFNPNRESFSLDDIANEHHVRTILPKHIPGKPKYKLGQTVMFKAPGDIYAEGTIEIVDSYGTFFQNEEPSYDIMCENYAYKALAFDEKTGERSEVCRIGECFVKHIEESLIVKRIRKKKVLV